MSGDYEIAREISDLIVEYYSVYGEEANQKRMIPNCIDMLKPVQRRIIEAAFNGAAGAGRDKLVKSASMMGDTMKAHPHGDASIYSSMVTLVQQGILHGRGNWGLNSGLSSEPPASHRYTECRIHPNILNLIKETFKSTDMVEGDLVMESVYIPCPIPLGLINNHDTNTSTIRGIGVGITTGIPCFKSKDLAKRMIDLLEKKSTPFVVPWDNASRKELKKLYKDGQGKVFTSGAYDMINDLELVITKLPYGFSGSRLLKSISAYLDAKSVEYRDESGMYTRIVLKCFTKKKMEEIKIKVDKIMTASTTFNFIVTDPKDHLVKRMNLDQILLYNMKYFVKSFKMYYQNIKDSLLVKKKELDLISKMKPQLKKEMSSGRDVDDVIVDIAKKIKETKETVNEVISKNSIKKLLTLNTDTKEIDNKVSKLDKKLNNTKKSIIEILKSIN